MALYRYDDVINAAIKGLKPGTPCHFLSNFDVGQIIFQVKSLSAVLTLFGFPHLFCMPGDAIIVPALFVSIIYQGWAGHILNKIINIDMFNSGNHSFI